jgi:hypothetical protein
MAQIAQETDPNIDLRPSSDDRNQALRGIPAVGRNVAGAIPGSSPRIHERTAGASPSDPSGT